MLNVELSCFSSMIILSKNDVNVSCFFKKLEEKYGNEQN